MTWGRWGRWGGRTGQAGGLALPAGRQDRTAPRRRTPPSRCSAPKWHTRPDRAPAVRMARLRNLARRGLWQRRASVSPRRGPLTPGAVRRPWRPLRRSAIAPSAHAGAALGGRPRPLCSSNRANSENANLKDERRKSNHIGRREGVVGVFREVSRQLHQATAVASAFGQQTYWLTEFPWHFLYILPLPQGHGLFRPTFGTKVVSPVGLTRRIFTSLNAALPSGRSTTWFTPATKSSASSG